MNRKIHLGILSLLLFLALTLALALPMMETTVRAQDATTTPAAFKDPPPATTYYLPLFYKGPYPIPPMLAWASGPEGVLLRWRWPKNAPPANAFLIYRDGKLLMTVQRVTDEGDAIHLLGNETWDWLKKTYQITTIAELHQFLDENPLVALWLADQQYPVALIRAMGFLDTSALIGRTYTYEVIAQTSLGPKSLGRLTIHHQGFTLLPAPTGLQNVQVLEDSLQGSPDWARAQRNRKANARVFLRWSLPTNNGLPTAWINAYDVYRASDPNGPYERINVENGEDKPVIPMPSYTPPNASGNYQEHPYFYADADPHLKTCQPYYYRVAPRDLLGHIADWNDPAQRSLFSDYMVATPPDTVPPAAPISVTATADPQKGVITVTWRAVTDAVKYIVYRSIAPDAAWPGLTDCVTCTTWVTMTTTSDIKWVDTQAQFETRYWYIVRALDAPCGPYPPNMSAPSRAVSAVLHDRTPPGQCHIESSPRHPYMHISCGEDATDILIYCRFDGGPEIMVAKEKGKTVNYDLSAFFTPAKPVRADCRAVAVDEHGNRAQPSDWAVDLPLIPPKVLPPSAPILHPVTTKEGGVHGWTAHLVWEAIDAPCLTGFRVYRESPGAPEVRIADESTLGKEKRTFQDDEVQWGVVYTYTVAAYRAAGDCGPALEVRSQPIVYRVVQPPNYPGRSVTSLAWGSRYYDEQGTHLSWALETKRIWYVVFRSLYQDRGYVAITPPMLDVRSYLDASAHHDRYWYMVVALDRSTGEPFAATTPWSANPTSSMLQSPTLSGPTERATPRTFAALPSVLYFGGPKGFQLHVTEYAPRSSLDDLNGEGDLYIYYPSQKIPTLIHLTFAHLKANVDGVITDGSVSLPTSALPLQVEQGFRYEITSLTLNAEGGAGNVTLHLPVSVFYHWHVIYPVPMSGLDDHVLLGSATIHPNLTFQRVLKWNLTCDKSTQTYFQLEDLPWKIIPTAPVTYTNESITFSAACALYLERYTGERPSAGEPDANDGLLRAVYTSEDAAIAPDGLSGTFNTSDNVHYGAVYPYGFELQLLQPTITLDAGAIISGTALSSYAWQKSYVGFEYFQHIAQINSHSGISQDTPEGHWSGNLSKIRIGFGGSIYAIASRALHFPPIPNISWLNGGLTLQNTTYELYIPPIQSARLPWQDALWPTAEHSWSDGKHLESGLNLRTTNNAKLVWKGCSNDPVTFSDGVTADLYIRRAGISDLIQAHIPTGSPMSIRLDDYQTRLQSFSLVFFDNALYDRDLSGAFYLPMPSDVLIPFRDATLDANACLASADVAATQMTPKYWQVSMTPDALEFRPQNQNPPGKRTLWLIGGVKVPHMAPVGSQDEVAAIPLETAFLPTGEFHDMRLQYNEVNYLLDGFAYLLSGVRLSDWSTHEVPGWEPSANLEPPPAGSWDEHGFVQVDGNMAVPIFGALVAQGTDDPPHVYVLGWDDYMGFSKPVQAKRTWTVLTDITWDFTLVYAQRPNHAQGAFVGFRHDDLYVVEIDQALILSSIMMTVENKPRFDIFLGLSAGTAALRALADTTQIAATDVYTDVRPTIETWRANRFPDMDVTYVDFLGALWDKYKTTTYTNTTALIDSLKDNDIPLPPDAPLAGGTKEWLDASGVKMKKMRGNVAWLQDTNTGDWDFAEMRMSIWLDIQKTDTITSTQQAQILADKNPTKEKTLFHADRITFYITRDNDYVVEGKNIKGSIFKGDSFSFKSFDATLAINPDKIRFEGGVLFHELKIKAVTFDPAAAVLGVGQDVYYLGALADAKYNNVKVGGAVLFGRIDTHSIVLRNIGFSDLLDNMHVISGSPSSMAGAYLRVYGDVPIYESGCMYRLHAGGELGIWYFADLEDESASWGGQLSGYVYGKLLCVVSARGDLTLRLWQRQDRDGLSYRGEFWVAGGVGWCEPEDWDTWENRWWDDSWCWTCGALIQANYNDDTPNAWEWITDADYE